MCKNNNRDGFTIVELLIVIVVIAILAAITIVSYNGISKRATETALKTDLNTAAKQLNIDKVEGDTYPVSNASHDLPDGIKTSDGNTFQYTSDGTTFCLTALPERSSISSYYITEDGIINEGTCAGHGPVAALYLQTITSANCPTTPTRSVDARDNHTYWVQKLSDGKCWMLTNLAYAGGGVTTFSDTVALQDGTADSSYDATTIQPKYYIPSSANPTTSPADPSSSTNGGVADPQYGYLYNWCAAMAGQATAACKVSATSPAVNSALTICPAGWRLPTGGGGGEFDLLNTAVNGGSTTTSAGLLATWRGQMGGSWLNTFNNQGTQGAYWTGNHFPYTSAYAIRFTASSVSPSVGVSKVSGLAIRCVAS